MKKQRNNKDLNYWSRKFHIHLGLFLLLFIWLFSLSGLLLNHGNWKFASFWENRKEKITVTSIHTPSNLDSAAMLKNIMQQLKISGEITRVWMTTDSIEFRVTIPGHDRNLHVDLKKATCVQKELTFNWWGKLRNLHTFNGVNKDNPDQKPNWLITRTWKFAMDAIAIGFIILCVSSWIMWYKLRKTYTWGPLILISGFCIAIYFVFFLKML
ncbi:MAG: hypothetical protein ABI760_22635 [Ferruginibacter sp.]